MPTLHSPTQNSMRKTVDTGGKSGDDPLSSPVGVNNVGSSFRRAGSLGSLTKANGRLSPFTARPKENTFNPAEGVLKFYLRGRALNFYAPSSIENYQLGNPQPVPKETLALEWVYGYRGRDARSNIFLLPTGEIVYFVAAVAVLYNPDEQMQRHYLGHTDDIKCLAVHPDKITIATGQVAGHDRKEGKKKKSSDLTDKSDSLPHVRIWNSISLATLKVIGIGEFDRAVSCVTFSKMDGGLYLVAVDEANEHIMSVWDWQKTDRGHKIVDTKSSTDPVLAVEFHPCEKNLIVSCGKSQVNFWTFDGAGLTRKQGIFEKNDKAKYVTALAFTEKGDVLTGDSNGNLFVWDRATCRITHSCVNAHAGGLFSICVMKDGAVVTGGKDRRIIKWDPTYKRTGEEKRIEEQFGGIRMLSPGKGSMLLVGTTKNCILQGSFDFHFSTIVQGHIDEVWGLATHPVQKQFATCGYDKNLYLFDVLSHTLLWSKELPDTGAHCVCFHPDGQLVVIGTCGTRWLVVDVTTRDIITSHSDSTERIECLAFSPDGHYLACGSRDNGIYVYAVSEAGHKYSRTGKCVGHSSFVTHLDWSRDGQFLQSCSGDYELLYWNMSTCKQITSASSMRDVDWFTHSCTLGFSVCGMWPEGADGTDINACARSNKQTLLASADDFGKVNLLTYPSYQPKSHAHSYSGHSSHVTNVQFLYDDSRLLTSGGKDTAIMQWQVVEG